MRRHTLAALAIGGLTLALLGCSGGSSGTSSSPKEEAAKVELKKVNAKEWDEAVQAHKGKVVVVDVWATTCPPCKKKFPDFLALSKKYPAADVVFLSLTVDEDGAHEAALKQLKEWNAGIPNYHYNLEEPPYNKALNIKSLPTSWVYGRDGKLAKAFDNPPGKEEFTEEQVEAEVKAQVAKK